MINCFSFSAAMKRRFTAENEEISDVQIINVMQQINADIHVLACPISNHIVHVIASSSVSVKGHGTDFSIFCINHINTTYRIRGDIRNRRSTLRYQRHGESPGKPYLALIHPLVDFCQVVPLKELADCSPLKVL